MILVTDKSKWAVQSYSFQLEIEQNHICLRENLLQNFPTTRGVRYFLLQKRFVWRPNVQLIPLFQVLWSLFFKSSKTTLKNMLLPRSTYLSQTINLQVFLSSNKCNIIVLLIFCLLFNWIEFHLTISWYTYFYVLCHRVGTKVRGPDHILFIFGNWTR